MDVQIDGWMYRQMDGQNFLSFYRTLSPYLSHNLVPLSPNLVYLILNFYFSPNMSISALSWPI